MSVKGDDMGKAAAPPLHRHSSAAALVAARIDRIPVGRFHVKVATTLGAGTFFDSFDALSIAVVLSLIVNSLGFGLAEAGVIISVGYLGQWVGMFLVGALADRLGRRRAFILACTIFGVMSLLCAVAWDPPSLLVFRAIQGLGLGAEVPIASILLSEHLGRHSRGRVTVLYQSVFAWGIFFAPLVALLSTSVVGPELGRRVLLGLGALPLLVAVWAWFLLPESARWLAVRGRLSEAETQVSAMEDEASARGVVLAEPEVTPAATIAPQEFRIGEILSPTYRRRTVLMALLWFANFFVNFGCLTWLPTMYVRIGGLPASGSLMLSLITSVLQIVIVYVAAALVDRIGRRPLLVGGLGIAAAGAIYGVIVIGMLGQSSWQNLFVSGCVMVVGTTMPAVVLYLYTSELYPTRMRSWATSSVSSLGKVASIISPSVFGLMLAAALLNPSSSAHAASPVSAPIEELNARLVEVMKAGKTTQFQQRFALLSPTIAHGC